jgi:hypothetical protein
MQKPKLPSFFYKRVVIALLVVLLVASCVAVGFVIGKLSVQKQIGTSANLVSTVNLSLYGDFVTGTQLVSINWGTILPTQSLRYTIWIQNDAAISLNISVSTRDWLPVDAQGNMTFTFSEMDMQSPNPYSWENQAFGVFPVLYAGKRAPLYLTLTAGENATSASISFVIVFQGDSL